MLDKIGLIVLRQISAKCFNRNVLLGTNQKRASPAASEGILLIFNYIKVNSMKHVLCYDGFVKEYKYIQRPQIDPNEALVYKIRRSIYRE